MTDSPYLLELKEEIHRHKLQDMAQIFKALADTTRLKIMYALVHKEELCVKDVAQFIGSSTATASHHLLYLKEHHIASSTRRGKQIFYRIADAHIEQLIQIAEIHSKEQ
ncbi:ArsR/SmtB family transcription factor [Kurthia sibirica]|nr:metalloregulator ArsR/SmtB family transcription factor [Kurthia sibirica]GEK33168.1 hypothetical protein KSI01_07010 [Kurthia sibirica]